MQRTNDSYASDRGRNNNNIGRHHQKRRNSSDEENVVRLSKKLSTTLRHKAVEKGLNIGTDHTRCFKTPREKG